MLMGERENVGGEEMQVDEWVNGIRREARTSIILLMKKQHVCMKKIMETE